ncbi:MAG: hypothetical protein HRU71_02015 [Planctomycetia bacterium]|nr:MAG: hypothetical protein HRU71_02015 [Planctomycetia bacterium]
MFRFVLTFAGCMAIYYVLSSLSLFHARVFPAFLKGNAIVAARVLEGVGQGPVEANGSAVCSQRFSVEVARGCDAIEPIALLVSAILASPMSIRARLAGMAAGALCLMAMNLMRIVTLFLFGVYWPAAFHVMHVDVWQVIFILLAVAIWLAWAWWALGRESVARARVQHA